MVQGGPNDMDLSAMHSEEKGSVSFCLGGIAGEAGAYDHQVEEMWCTRGDREEAKTHQSLSGEDIWPYGWPFWTFRNAVIFLMIGFCCPLSIFLMI